MSTSNCPINDTIAALRAFFDDARLVEPRNRRRAENILALLEDIAWGRAGDDHLAAIDGLVEELSTNAQTESATQVAELVSLARSEHQEVFLSHIKTHNCPTGDCVKLAAAPCQMTCPAGLDVPTYVTLIGLGRFSEAVDVIRRDCPFPWVCGLVCTRPCEFMCVRGRIDTPIAIKSLKAFAAERAMSDGNYANPEKAPAQEYTNIRVRWTLTPHKRAVCSFEPTATICRPILFHHWTCSMNRMINSRAIAKTH